MSCISGGGRDRAWGFQGLGAGAGLREGGKGPKGKATAEFPQGLSKRSFWARLGCSPTPVTKVSFLPPSHSLLVSSLPPDRPGCWQRWGSQSGEELQELGVGLWNTSSDLQCSGACARVRPDCLLSPKLFVA